MRETWGWEWGWEDKDVDTVGGGAKSDWESRPLKLYSRIERYRIIVKGK